MRFISGLVFLALASKSLAGKCVWKSTSLAAHDGPWPQTSNTPSKPSLSPYDRGLYAKSSTTTKASAIPYGNSQPTASPSPKDPSVSIHASQPSSGSIPAPSGIVIGASGPGNTNLINGGSFEDGDPNPAGNEWNFSYLKGPALHGEGAGAQACPYQNTVPCDENGGSKFFILDAILETSQDRGTWILEQDISNLLVSENDMYYIQFDAIGYGDPSVLGSLTGSPGNSTISISYPNSGNIIFTTDGFTNSWQNYGFMYFPDNVNGTFGIQFNAAGHVSTFAVDNVSVELYV